MDTIHVVYYYDYDGTGGSHTTAYSFNKTLEGAIRYLDNHGDNTFDRYEDVLTGYPVLRKGSGKYAYEMIYIEKEFLGE